MIPLDNFEKWGSLMESSACLYLNENEYKGYSLISEEEKKKQLKDLLEKPIASFTPINDVYFRGRWAEVLEMIHPQKNLKLLEIASGDADMIPQVKARTHPNSNYFTTNMNKILNDSLLEKTKDLSLNVEIIDDDAINIENYIEKGAIDIIAFQHSINDIIQAILCDREGVDTIYSDWMETLPVMIEILKKEVSANTLEEHSKNQFLVLISALLNLLKDDGIIVMNHYMFQLDLDWGYPRDLFENIIPMTREWVSEIDDVKEIYYTGFDSNWWMFLKKSS